MTQSGSSRRRRRLWKFSGAEFDEASWALRVEGQAVTLEGKPLEVLHELLLRAGEVVTKDEILDAVWPGVTVVEGSLPTAISKLRKALGSRREQIIETIPRVGYKIASPVAIESIEAPLAPRFAFHAGDTVPGRKQWQLVEPLGDSGAEDVWLARHDKTGEERVFKFADAPDRLRGLKREAALTRLLFAGLGKAAPLPPLLEWNFEASPFFLEYGYGGRDLTAWGAGHGGLARVPLEKRLAVAAMIARAVARMHDLGVLHKDLKPANILLATEDGTDTVRLADFGSGRLLDDTVLANFQITDPGSLDPDLARDEPRSGTLAYRAPELVGDAVPTVKSDIYALGMILYQLAVGDFSASLAPGWESRIADRVLRGDILTAAEGDPAARLASASLLAERLETLERRRDEARDEAERAVAREAARREEERRSARRPWIRLAFASLLAGFVASTLFGLYAWHQRSLAFAARDQAETSYAFIAEEVLSSPDPAKSGAEETVLDAVKRASASIDTRYVKSPATAARLHLAVARAFHQRSDFDTARAEYARATMLFEKAGEADSEDAVLGRLGSVHLDATSGQPERLEAAGAALAREIARLGERTKEGRIGFALAQSEGAYAYMADIERAEQAFRRAVAIASAPDSRVQPTQLLKARSSLLLTMLRLGQIEKAEPMARAIVADSTRIRGASSPDTLVTRQHWVNALSMLGEHERSLRESGPLLAAMQKRFGRDHRFTLALHSARFESLAALGRYDEAASEAKRVWDGAAMQAGPLSHQAIVGQNDYASALCQTARRREALGVLEDAAAKSISAFGSDYALTHTVRYYLGECLLANRRFADADAVYSSIDSTKVAELTGRPTFAATLTAARAEAVLGLGDRQKGQMLLSAASKLADGSNDPELRQRLERLRKSPTG
ncbi:MAG: winged helix-turn-helix domain-containing protein [Sphingopyxis sp.]|uniref:protein kinase domain-containing protein n=1 Tax=Sphingopyxis sp. TaxID=1908224 RepID=UPI001A18EA80|nr:winged helix-turn-helix domain-containing protein [Sphingopyxis sp.]MBJ7499414.1 winged helix-turn-helix domain-containing protein [Sphingopyxis sp.]